MAGNFKQVDEGSPIHSLSRYSQFFRAFTLFVLQLLPLVIRVYFITFDLNRTLYIYTSNYIYMLLIYLTCLIL